MTLILETGAQAANSNSYVTEAQLEAYAEGLGVTLVGDLEPMLRKAAEFIDSHEANLKGSRVARDQSMAFPRVDVVIYNEYWASDEIPRQVKDCQMALAIDINAGIDLYNKPVNPNTAVKRERVEGAVEVEYAVGESTGQKLTRSSRADALLNSLLNRSGLFGLRMVRT